MRRKRIPQSIIRQARDRIDQIKKVADELRATKGKAQANDYLRSLDTASKGKDAIMTLIRAGAPLPEWIGTNWRYLEAMGWHQPHLSLPWNSSLLAKC